MSHRFRIDFKESNGNLHIRPKGPLDGSSACALLQFLHDHYGGTGRVFIDTRDLEEILPFGCSTFQSRLNRKWIPADRMYFKGDKGFKLAPDGSRVLVLNENRRQCCDDRCENCTCGKARPPMPRTAKNG